MSTRSFSESGLSFQFPEGWTTIKYDEHRFYTYLSGEWLKGVDFIAIHGENLVLIEVKNYTDRIIKENFDPMEGLHTEPEVYVESFLRKFKDTFRLLGVIESFYQRKWWYRNFFRPFKQYFSNKKQIKTETAFWSRAIELLNIMDQVHLILWLELPAHYDPGAAEKLYAYFEKNIREQIPEGARFHVAHAEQPFGEIKVKSGLL